MQRKDNFMDPQDNSNYVSEKSALRDPIFAENTIKFLKND